MIYKDEFVQRQLRMGDVYRIPAGSTFYIVNTGETQRLHIICSIDPYEGLGVGTFQSFFVGGGANPVSVLAGFDPQTLSTALNVSIGELRDIMTAQGAGPIMYADTTHAPSLWANFLKLKDEEKLKRLKMMAATTESSGKEEEEGQSNWSWGKLWESLVGKQNRKGDKDRRGDRKKGSDKGSGPDPHNLYHRDPDFRNAYGWSIALDGHSYHPLKKSGVGVFLVNLTAGSMLAPHLNPTATEYGIVLSGRGSIQVVYPNGSSAMTARVSEGDVFWIPKYFPFCQIASRAGPFEFFGFTTSAHRNRPQFLVGASSILNTMRGPELATAFGLTEERFDEIVGAQREAIILPSPAAAPPDGRERSKSEGEGSKSEAEEKKQPEVPKLIRTLGPEIVVGLSEAFQFY